MPRLAVLPRIFAASVAILVTALAFTTYTAPIEGAASDPTLYTLIAAALHDSQPASQPLLGHSPLPIIPGADQDTVLHRSHRAERSGPTVASDDATAWTTAAAAVDSGALRDWLGRWVLATTTTSHDTMRLTLHRWSHRPGCPYLNTLVATTVGAARREWRLVSITATCPVLPETPAAMAR